MTYLLLARRRHARSSMATAGHGGIGHERLHPTKRLVNADALADSRGGAA